MPGTSINATAITDPVYFIKYEFDESWNAHDLEGVMACFAPGATVIIHPPPPGTPDRLTGYEEITPVVQSLLPGFRVESSAFQTSGTNLKWVATILADSLPAGVTVVKAHCEADFAKGHLSSLTITFTP
jgi:hypothetical protein